MVRPQNNQLLSQIDEEVHEHQSKQFPRLPPHGKDKYLLNLQSPIIGDNKINLVKNIYSQNLVSQIQLHKPKQYSQNNAQSKGYKNRDTFRLDIESPKISPDLSPISGSGSIMPKSVRNYNSMQNSLVFGKPVLQFAEHQYSKSPDKRARNFSDRIQESPFAKNQKFKSISHDNGTGLIKGVIVIEQEEVQSPLKHLQQQEDNHQRSSALSVNSRQNVREIASDLDCHNSRSQNNLDKVGVSTSDDDDDEIPIKDSKKHDKNNAHRHNKSQGNWQKESPSKFKKTTNKSIDQQSSGHVKSNAADDANNIDAELRILQQIEATKLKSYLPKNLTNSRNLPQQYVSQSHPIQKHRKSHQPTAKSFLTYESMIAQVNQMPPLLFKAQDYKIKRRKDSLNQDLEDEDQSSNNLEQISKIEEDISTNTSLIQKPESLNRAVMRVKRNLQSDSSMASALKSQLNQMQIDTETISLPCIQRNLNQEKLVTEQSVENNLNLLTKSKKDPTPTSSKTNTFSSMQYQMKTNRREQLKQQVKNKEIIDNSQSLRNNSNHVSSSSIDKLNPEIDQLKHPTPLSQNIVKPKFQQNLDSQKQKISEQSSSSKAPDLPIKDQRISQVLKRNEQSQQSQDKFNQLMNYDMEKKLKQWQISENQKLLSSKNNSSILPGIVQSSRNNGNAPTRRVTFNLEDQ